MFQVDNSTAVAVRPTPAAAGTPGWFTKGDPVGGVPATIVPDDFLNMVQAELIGLLTATSITPSKTDTTQVLAAIRALIKAASVGIGYMMVTHETASGTAAGASTANTFVVRVLNTLRANTISGASLASNQITLPAGTYRIRASAPANGVNLHTARLYNVTDAASAIIGTSENTTSLAATPSETTQTRSFVDGRITITATKVFELRHYCQELVATNGLGSSVSAGGSEVYSVVEIIKEA